MTKVYEVDRNADALLIVSGANEDGHSAAAHHHHASGKSAKTNGHHVNGVTNGHTEEEPSHELLRLKVSSKHLILASQRFKNKFDRNGESFAPTQSDGRLHFQVHNFDPTAVTTVMNIIHSRGRRVPKSLDLDALTKVAQFVDEYKFDEAVEAYADRWIAALSKSIPSTFSRQTIQWLYLAHVFQHQDLFRKVSRLAIIKSTGPISDLGTGFHLPEAVIAAIDEKRQELIGEVDQFLRDLVEELQEGKTPCANGCDTFLLGVLVKALHHWKLAKPYRGISFEALATAVRDVQDEVWYTGPHPVISLGDDARKEPETSSDVPRPHARKIRFGAHHCGNRTLINPKLYSLEVSLVGLVLKSGL